MPPERRRTLAYLALVVAACLFGATFVVVKQAVTLIPPLAFVGWRFLIGSVALFALAFPRGRSVWRDGVIAGTLLFAGYAFQTEGLALTSAANSGLITGLYVVFTPIIAAVVARTKLSGWAVSGTGVAFVGLALLTIREGVRFDAGDLLTVGCAVAFAAHIVVLSRVAARHPVVPFTAVQLLVTAVLATSLSWITEGIPLPTIDVIPALLMTGLIVTAGAFLMQVWSQTVIGPARTAVVLTLEPVSATLLAALLLAERLDAKQWTGAALILAGIYLVLARTSEMDTIPAAEAITPAH
jgi:drug/metabolite transporter (DMT)-like permease